MKKRSSSEKSQKRTAKTKGTLERITIGLDLGDKTSRYCLLNNEREILREGQATTTKAGLVKTFGALGQARIAIEVGTHSPWVSRLLRDLGHEVIVPNPKQVKLITESSRKGGPSLSMLRRKFRCRNVPVSERIGDSFIGHIRGCVRLPCEVEGTST